MAQKKILLMIVMLLSITSCKCNENTKLRKVEPIPCYPQEEVCNGKDDDCDGQIDEDTSVACSTACGSGIRGCLRGELLACPAQEPALIDICNDIDDDCDGQIDEDAEVRPCYPRDNKELTQGECRFGVERCISGKYSCVGWIGPKNEDCNGKDDDCDGSIDEGVSNGLDIVLILDTSCSMGDRTKQLANTTAQWATKYSSRADLRFALVTAPSSSKPNRDGLVTLEQNFSNTQDFITILQAQIYSMYLALEATIDAIYDVSTPSNPLGLNWLSGSNKTIIVYSDESKQSWRSPALTTQQAIDEAKNNNVSVYVFTNSYNLLDWSVWNSQIFLEGTELEEALDKIISDNSCK